MSPENTDEEKKAELAENVNIISGLELEKESIKLKSTAGKIIRSSGQVSKSRKVQVIGGDSDELQPEAPPSIIIEKENDRISRIIVKCPCGRYSELVCEYEDDELQNEEGN